MEQDIDSRDVMILQKLSQEIDGLGYNEILRRTQFNKKTLTSHLKKLQESNLIAKEKLGKKQNSPTFYKANLDPSIKDLMMKGFDINSGVTGSDYTLSELCKNAMISAIPPMILGLVVTYYQSILEYITGKITRMELQFVSKILIDYVDEELKKNIDNKLSKKRNIERLFSEGIAIHSNELERLGWMISDSMDRKELRTSHEIKILSDTISPIRVYWSGEDGINRKNRSELIKDPNKRSKFKKLEKDYVDLLRQLVPLQRKLIGRFPDHKLSEHELV